MFLRACTRPSNIASFCITLYSFSVRPAYQVASGEAAFSSLEESAGDLYDGCKEFSKSSTFAERADVHSDEDGKHASPS